jgi:hypothetical protein
MNELFLRRMMIAFIVAFIALTVTMLLRSS